MRRAAALMVMWMVPALAGAQVQTPTLDAWIANPPPVTGPSAGETQRALREANEQLNLDRTNRTVESYQPRRTVCTRVGGVTSCTTY